LLALVILIEDLCGRVSACYNEGMVTPVIARRFLSTNKHTARGTVWKTVGRASFPGSARPTLSAVTFHYADILQTYIQAFNIFRRYGSVKRLAQRFTNSSCWLGRYHFSRLGFTDGLIIQARARAKSACDQVSNSRYSRNVIRHPKLRQNMLVIV